VTEWATVRYKRFSGPAIAGRAWAHRGEGVGDEALDRVADGLAPRVRIGPGAQAAEVIKRAGDGDAIGVGHSHRPVFKATCQS